MAFWSGKDIMIRVWAFSVGLDHVDRLLRLPNANITTRERL
jgi:hypothetical protein